MKALRDRRGLRLREPGVDGEVADEDEGVGVLPFFEGCGEGAIAGLGHGNLSLEQAQQGGWGQLAEEFSVHGVRWAKTHSTTFHHSTGRV